MLNKCPECGMSMKNGKSIFKINDDNRPECKNCGYLGEERYVYNFYMPDKKSEAMKAEIKEKIGLDVDGMVTGGIPCIEIGFLRELKENELNKLSKLLPYMVCEDTWVRPRMEHYY